MSTITPRGKISQTELLKSIRDLLVMSVGALVPQVLTLLEATDFGEWNLVASVVLAALSTFINRFFNIARVK